MEDVCFQKSNLSQVEGSLLDPVFFAAPRDFLSRPHLLFADHVGTWIFLGEAKCIIDMSASTTMRRLVLYILLLVVLTFLISSYLISSTIGSAIGNSHEMDYLSFLPPDENQSCVAFNSEEWLRSSRVHNLNESLPSAFIRNMTLGFHPKTISDFRTFLEQSLADSESRFLALSDFHDIAQLDLKTARLWAVRLVYLSIMYHQHKPAMPEAKVREEYDVGNECQSELQKYGVGNFDFECPATKYIIGGLTNNGLGSNVRAATTTMLMAGLITNRTTLILQNGKEGPKFLQKHWKLASCERHDFECFFLPLTPCVPTWQDVKTAHILEGTFNDYFGRNPIRTIPADQMENKVWILQKYGVTTSPPVMVATMVYEYSSELIQKLSLAPHQKRMLSLAVKQTLKADESRATDTHIDFEYPAAHNALNHALAMYALRPNFESGQKLAEIMEDIVPPSITSSVPLIGLPIRASDKCYRESECLPFDDYMKAVELVWQRYRLQLEPTSGPLVLFTTESKEMVKAQRNFSRTSSLEFLVNSRDVTPNSGLISEVAPDGRFSADETMLSAISTFSFQLKARVSILNCCSNFHMLLKE